MDIPSEARAIEDRLRLSGKSIQPVLDEAGVVRSTWSRWKSGSFMPRLDSWLKVKAASEKAISEPSNARSSEPGRAA